MLPRLASKESKYIVSNRKKRNCCKRLRAGKLREWGKGEGNKDCWGGEGRLLGRMGVEVGG